MPCRVIYDSAVPIYLPNVDVVFVGCEAVLANGGIVNKIGTYSVALIAQHFQKQVYVFTESHKFTEVFPLS
jgi:translation initiation factor eIF-2B subunit alpha